MENNKVSNRIEGPRKYVFGDPICDYDQTKCDTPDLLCSKCYKAEMSDQDRYGDISAH
jgi:hypothetical protein